MSIEFGLILLESILLIVTIILLIYNIHEGRQRDLLLREVGRATKILTRQEYFLTVVDAMFNAEREIVGCITGSLPADDERNMTENIAAVIEKLTVKGVRISYLLPKFPDRLHIGMRYGKAGADIRFSNSLMVHTIRYSIVDEKMVVLGIPESTGEKEATKKGYKIPSEGLAVILKAHFEVCDKHSDLKGYLQEVIAQSGATPDQVAREFRLNEKDVRELLR